MKTKAKLKEEAINAESRALKHWGTVRKIELILEEAELEKTPAVFIVEQIKETIADQSK